MLHQCLQFMNQCPLDLDDIVASNRDQARQFLKDKHQTQQSLSQ